MAAKAPKNEQKSAPVTNRPTPLAMPRKRAELTVTPLSPEVRAQLAQLEK